MSIKNVRPKKNLGQHFLKDESIASRIAESLSLTERMAVIEVGPGMGVLTKYLLEDENINLTAIEFDTESVNYLKENYKQLNIINGDFLKIDLKEICLERFCIIGNYPYNISNQIFFKLLDYRDDVFRLSGMVQKEVAQRVCAKTKTKARGILSVLLQAFFDVEYLFEVPPSVFFPEPKVDSAVIRLTRNSVSNLGCDYENLLKVVKTAFNQRRKVLSNSLRELINGNEEIKSSPFMKRRPEELSVEEFIELTNLIYKN